MRPYRLTDDPLWDSLLPLLAVQTYDREGGHRHPRRRLEVRDPGSALLRARLLGLQVQCAACGAWMQPIRQRQGPQAQFYLTVSCDTTKRPSCCRGSAAHDEYERIVSLVMGVPSAAMPAVHPRLF